MVTTLDGLLVRLANPDAFLGVKRPVDAKKDCGPDHPDVQAQMYGEVLYDLMDRIGEMHGTGMSKLLTKESLSKQLRREKFVVSGEDACRIAEDLLSRCGESARSLGTGFKLSKVMIDGNESSPRYVIKSTGAPSHYIARDLETYP